MTTTNLAANWAEIEKQVYGATFAIGAENTDAITVSVQLTDRDGKAARWPSAVEFYLSSSANGLTPASVATSIAAGSVGAVTGVVGATSGVAVTNASGAVDIVLTNATTTPTRYLVIVLPTRQLVVSGAITWA